MFAAGLSGTALLRPVAMFGLGVTVLARGGDALSAAGVQVGDADPDRRDARRCRGRLPARGGVRQPGEGLTVYLREMGRPGEMLGVFVHDEREPERVVTYTAERAVLAEQDGRPHLVMFEGLAQTVEPEGTGRRTRLSLLRFDRFTYDLGQLTRGQRRARAPEAERVFPAHPARGR